jgi:Flp pilus assembly protein TadG
MAAVVPLLAVLLSGLFALGPFVHLSFATRQTAYDCAVAAAQSLDAKQGAQQGEMAGQLTAASYRLLTGNISFTVQGEWSRHGQVSCTAVYRIPTGRFPLRVVVPLPGQYAYTVRLPLQVWHSTWR